MGIDADDADDVDVVGAFSWLLEGRGGMEGACCVAAADMVVGAPGVI